MVDRIHFVFLSVGHFYDLGKLLFAFTVFWAYIAVSQFVLYWYGNIPEEHIFYAKRWFIVPTDALASKDWPESTWRYVTLFLALGHFVVPFLFLMPRTIKRARACDSSSSIGAFHWRPSK